MQLVAAEKYMERDLRDYFHYLTSDNFHLDRYVMKTGRN